MRYGLGDPRNYDSIELTRSLDWFEPLFEPSGGARTSRRDVTWEGVLRARDRLRGAGVAAVVSAARPPEALAGRSERLRDVWLTRLDAEPLVSAAKGTLPPRFVCSNGTIAIETDQPDDAPVVIRVTFDPGWRAFVDGKPARVETYMGVFMEVCPGAGRHRVRLEYDPAEARAALAISLAGLAAALAAFSGFHPLRRG
jgi:hypothetical protein